MAKTRRQRALEHPDLPKKGVRDPRRIPKQDSDKNPAAVALGRLGGKAYHDKRGFQGMTADQRREIALKGVEARKERDKDKPPRPPKPKVKNKVKKKRVIGPPPMELVEETMEI